MTGRLRLLLALGQPLQWAKVLSLSLVSAASEGFGFILLVPLLARMESGGSLALPTGIPLPSMGLGGLLAIFAVLVAVRALADLARALAAHTLRVRVVDGLRMQAFAALVRAEWRTLAGMDQSANRALIISTVDRVGYAVQLMTDALRLSLGLAALTLAAFAISPRVALAVAVAGALITLAHRGLRRRGHTLGAAVSRAYEVVYLKLEQALNAVRLIKSFGREQQTLVEFGAAFDSLRTVERAFIRDTALARAALQIGGAATLALLIWLAHERWGASMATLLPLAALAVRALPLLGLLQESLQNWMHEAPALNAAQTLVAQAQASAEPQVVEAAPGLRHAIVVQGVTLTHAADRPALANITLTIPALAITALTGPSGAGKSTLADLIGGLLAPDTGRILVDDVPLEGGARIAWRSHVAYVQQEPILFAGTVRDNLLWATPDASEAQLADALERAAASFVHALPGGIDCDLGAAGRALSGGERQRIALARALLREPRLLILDEATSALDDGSERAIADAVSALAGRCTVLVIGHRGALTAIAQHRIHLESGSIASG